MRAPTEPAGQTWATARRGAVHYEIRIQDPTSPPRSPLFDELVALAGDGKIHWIRMFFGFLTGSGLDALLGVPEIRHVLLHSEVEVLVGLDAVTDRPGLERLRELARENPKFQPLVIKNTTGALIHPKMLVAQYEDGRSVAVVGSNNLSLSGLSGNVEGYTIARFEPEEQVDLAEWDEFKSRWDDAISEIDDDALKAAEGNASRIRRLRNAVRRTRTRPGSGVVVSDGQAHEIPESGVADLEEPLLVAQVPGAGGRWSQVHYSAEIMEEYFKVNAGDRVYMRQHDSTNVEERQVVFSERNKNYKIELGAAKSAGDYPKGHPPVVIFRQEGTGRRYRYILLMPGNDGHTEMTDLAKATFEGRGNHLARVIVSRSSVLTAWPECPL